MANSKRIFDFGVGSIALIVLSPLLFMVAILVRLTLGRPVLFCQTRPGLKAEPFTILKFRTMSNACSAAGKLLPDAQRLTSFGRFLRSTSLDELPELINVIRGDMSLVGPRPLLFKYLPHYTTEQMRRHEVKPGITGWAQINGRNALTWDQKFTFDLWYVDHQSFGFDVRILVRTAWLVVKREGIVQRGHVTMPEFLGAAADNKRGGA